MTFVGYLYLSVPRCAGMCERLNDRTFALKHFYLCEHVRPCRTARDRAQLPEWPAVPYTYNTVKVILTIFITIVCVFVSVMSMSISLLLSLTL